MIVTGLLIQLHHNPNSSNQMSALYVKPSEVILAASSPPVDMNVAALLTVGELRGRATRRSRHDRLDRCCARGFGDDFDDEAEGAVAAPCCPAPARVLRACGHGARGRPAPCSDAKVTRHLSEKPRCAEPAICTPNYGHSGFELGFSRVRLGRQSGIYFLALQHSAKPRYGCGLLVT